MKAPPPRGKWCEHRASSDVFAEPARVEKGHLVGGKAYGCNGGRKSASRASGRSRLRRRRPHAKPHARKCEMSRMAKLSLKHITASQRRAAKKAPRFRDGGDFVGAVDVRALVPRSGLVLATIKAAVAVGVDDVVGAVQVAMRGSRVHQVPPRRSIPLKFVARNGAFALEDAV